MKRVLTYNPYDSQKRMLSRIEEESEQESSVEDGSSIDSDSGDEQHSDAEDSEQQEDEWIGNEDDFPNFPKIPDFRGPQFKPQTSSSHSIFIVLNPAKITPLQWFFLY